VSLKEIINENMKLVNSDEFLLEHAEQINRHISKAFFMRGAKATEEAFNFLRRFSLVEILAARELLLSEARRQTILSSLPPVQFDNPAVFTESHAAAIFSLIHFDPIGKEGFTLITAGQGKALVVVKQPDQAIPSAKSEESRPDQDAKA
jgi:hypothetical protein